MRSGSLHQVAVPCPKKNWIRRIWNKLWLNAILDLGLIYFSFKLNVQEYSRDERTLIGLDINAEPGKWRITFRLTKPFEPWAEGPKWRHWPHLYFVLKLSKYIQIETMELSEVRAVKKGENFTNCVCSIIQLHALLFKWRWVRELYSPNMLKNVCFVS